MLDTKISSIEELLAALEVTGTTLSAGEKKQLDEAGYLIFPRLLAPKDLQEVREAIEALTEQEKTEEGHREKGTRHIADLANKGAVFSQLFTHPKQIAAAYHVLQRDFGVGIHAREPLQGFGQQGLHADAMTRNADEPFSGLTTIWALDDFSEENGGTRYVPGSHLWAGKMPKSLGQPNYTHREQKQLVVPAGTLFVFNAHLWHSGMTNQSRQRRRSVIAVYHGCERPSLIPSTQDADPPVYLSPAAAYLAGYRDKTLKLNYFAKE